jgi:ATP-dependent Lon protease
MKKDFRISSAEFSDMLNEDTEFLPLMSDEDEAKISKEDTPNELPILPLRNTFYFQVLLSQLLSVEIDQSN